MLQAIQAARPTNPDTRGVMRGHQNLEFLLRPRIRTVTRGQRVPCMAMSATRPNSLELTSLNHLSLTILLWSPRNNLRIWNLQRNRWTALLVLRTDLCRPNRFVFIPLCFSDTIPSSPLQQAANRLAETQGASAELNEEATLPRPLDPEDNDDMELSSHEVKTSVDHIGEVCF
jgi:hypothetical protein